MSTKTSKYKYWNKKGKPGPWDYIIIGSGMGGMTAAAMLTKLGKRVLVLEQHYVPGGFTHTFKRKKWVWDVGVHAVGEVTQHSMTGRLLSDLTDGRLKWTSLGDVYDEFYYPDDFKIDFPDSPRAFRDNLVKAFPDEHRAIDRYLAYAGEVAKAMKGYYLARALPPKMRHLGDLTLGRKAQGFLDQRTQDVVEDLTSNKKLQSLFSAQWGYYGSPPKRSSFAIQALVVRHFYHGGYYPVGGSQEIANQLLKTVADGGGWTRISTDVEEILIEDGQAVGVRLKDGEEIRAGRVISAAGVMSTVGRLLPESSQREEWVDEIKQLNPAPAHVCLYLGFKGDIREAGASSANKWFYGTWDPNYSDWMVEPDKELPDVPVLYCSFPSLKDPLHDPGPDQLHTGEVVTFVPWEIFNEWKNTRWQKRGESYDAFKKRMEDKILENFLERMPGLRDKLEYVELSTPLSTDYFCRPMAGSIYGIEPTPERFRNPWLRPRSPIGNLLMAGSEVTSVGVMGAMMGGVLAATSAEPVDSLKLLRHT
ncbi:MAG: NAD(P)/FAD-dependent oxidoreductase [Myxococcota bacterium]|nr:NAD(P)/FAD-dependent oxidoreductase [Myxococcota bacterium]